MLETLDYTIRIGSTPTFLYFDLFIWRRVIQLSELLDKGDIPAAILKHSPRPDLGKNSRDLG